MQKVLGSLAAAGLILGSASAGSLTVANSDIKMGGGVTAGYFYATNNGSSNDYFTVSNFVVDFKGKSGILSFTASFGSVAQPDLLETVLTTSGSFKPSYAWVSIEPVKGLTVDAGLLTTNIGYELYHTYDNLNYLFGLVWWGQPVTYPGARVTYSIAEGIDVYAEYNQDTAAGASDAFAVGSLGSVGGMDYAISYYDYEASKNLIDVVLGYSVGGADVGLNLDYQWLDDSAKTAGADDTAYGVALYINPSVAQNITVPVRLEYINQGTSKIYASSIGESAYSITVTPTYKPTSNTYIRGEVAYVSTDAKAFPDNKGNSKDNKLVVGFEAGFVF
ncbi:outer membrane beta-barrel protein [Persephonella sp.]